MSQVVERIVSSCAAAGLDLNATSSVGSYNAVVDRPFHLPGADDSLTIVVGNTRAIWPHIGEFVRAQPSPPPDPVDTYVESVIRSATSGCTELIDVRYAHESPPRRIAIQRLAHVAGLAWLSPSHLCIHPTFGPWIALRAAIVLDMPAPPARQPLAAPCDCAGACAPLLAEALAAAERVDSASVRSSWRRWLAMRDACPVGRRHRYDDDQIEYHYIGTTPSDWTS
jgi:methylmalonic aciduria homocystinuria type C protein